MKKAILVQVFTALMAVESVHAMAKAPVKQPAPPAPQGPFEESQSPGGYSYEENEVSAQYWADYRCRPHKADRVSPWRREPVHYARFPGTGLDPGYTEFFEPVSADFRCKR